MPERLATIERLCHEALERRASERAAFLAEACAGDDALRQEVESLLAQESGSAGFLSTPAVARRVGAATLVGRSLGPYVISAWIAEGGMGEVYRARDTKLGRDVAIKVLPTVFTSDPERLARFEREARVLAALNHTHIGAIYGLENVDGIPALVLELVEGPTLEERLSKAQSLKSKAGALAMREALTIARQIADALEAAHERGIVHRDLKPANIKITPDGVVKVLDFGLAKLRSEGAGEAEVITDAPKLTIGGTREGMILGTAAYMSPEQARGQAIDKRSDIWAFGCVLYETLTSRAVFAADTVSDTIVAVLERSPAWDTLPRTTPTSIRSLLRHCLEKDPRRRLRDIGDARLALDEGQDLWVVSAPKDDVRWKVATAVLTLFGMVALVAWWSASRPADQHQPSVHLPVDLGADAAGPIGEDEGTGPALSPDGKRLVYRALGARGRVQLFTRVLSQDEATPLAGTDDHTALSFRQTANPLDSLPQAS